MPGSPRIVSSSGARSRDDARERRRAGGSSSALAADQRPVEPAADRGSVGVESRAAGSRRRRARRRGRAWRTTLPGRLGEPDLAARGRPREPLGGGRPPRRSRAVDRRRRRPPRCRRRSARAGRTGAAARQLRGRTERALRVVLVRDRDAEDGHDGVAAQLDDAAAVARADRAAAVVVALEHGAQRLRVEPGDLVRVGELRERRRSPSGVRRARAGRASRRRGRRGHVLAQDRRLQRAQLAATARCRGRRRARGARRGRRRARRPGGPRGRARASAGRGAARAADARDERLELAGDLGVPAAGEVGVDALAQAGEPQVLEPRDLGLREALVARRPRAPGRATARAPAAASPPPPTARRARAPRGRAGSAPRSGRRRAPPAAAQRVAAALVDARGPSPSARPQPRREHLDGVARVSAGPSPSHSSSTTRSTCDDGAAVHEQQGEERERAAARHTGAPAVRQVDLDRAEDPELRVHLEREPIPARTERSESAVRERCRACRPRPSPAPGDDRASYAPWGMLAAIDLHGGDRARLADPDSIRALRARR